MGALNKEQILTANDIKTEKVAVPEWGGHIYVRVMSGKERDDYEASCLKQVSPTRFITDMSMVRAKLAARCICDENGQRLFDNKDIAALAEKSGRALDRVMEVAERINGLSKQDMEKLAGESASGQSEDSGTD